MVDTNTLVLLGCFAAAAVVLFWLDRRSQEEIEPERRRDKMPTVHMQNTGLTIERNKPLNHVETFQDVSDTVWPSSRT